MIKTWFGDFVATLQQPARISQSRQSSRRSGTRGPTSNLLEVRSALRGVEALEVRALLSATTDVLFYPSGVEHGPAGVDVPAGVYSTAEVEALEAMPFDSSLSSKTPAASEDGGHASDVLTFVLDFKEAGQGDTSDIFGNVISTFDPVAWGFAAGDIQTIANAVLAEVDDDFFGELVGTVAGPSGQDLVVDFIIGDIGTAPPGVSEYYYVQIGTGTTGPHTDGTLGVAGSSVVRNSTGGGPNSGIQNGDVVASVFTDAIVTMGGLTPSNALTSGNLGFTTHAITGTTSHEIAHTVSLSHINKAGSVQPTSGASPLMGTGAIDLPNQDRITDREFSLSGVDGQNGDAPRQHVQQLVDALGLHDVGEIHDGQIHGQKWNDLDGDGVKDAGEPGLEGVTIYLDLNNNGSFDTGEPSTITMADVPGTSGVDETGNYSFTGLAAGTYIVREVIPAGFEQTFPVAPSPDTAASNTTGDNSGIATLPVITTTAAQLPIYVTGVEVPRDITTNTAQSGPVINVDAFRAAFPGIDGSGGAVAILDTGIDLNHPFFGPDANSDGVADRIVHHQDFANLDNDASDVGGHGSNVTSIALGQDATHTGMAPGADIIALKVFTDAGAGNFGMVESALQWVLANAAAFDIRAINMSLGDSGNYNTPQARAGIDDELASLKAAGVIIVSAAGNDFFTHSSNQGVAYPAADSASLAVGATFDANIGGVSYGSGATANSSAADRLTPFSQRSGVMTDIFAPGAAIVGAGPTGGTTNFHGTSQAAPHIAGIAALAQQLALQEIGRLLTQDEFADLLQSTGVTINDGDDEDDNVTNTGLNFQRVDVLALGQAIVNMGSTGTELLVNGGFETGDYSGWTVSDSTGLGAWRINNGSLDPLGPAVPTAPLAGSFDSVSTQEGAGIRILTQQVTIPASVGTATLSWLDRILNAHTSFVDPTQEFRVLLRETGGSLIQEVFSTNPGDATQQPGPNSRSFDVTSALAPYAGQTVQLVFAQEDNLDLFNVTIDDVSLNVTPASSKTPGNGFWTVELASGDSVEDVDFGNHRIDDHGNTPQAATTVLTPSSTPGNLEVAGDNDFFAFPAVAGASYSFATVLGTLADSTLELFDVNGTTSLVFDDDGGPGTASLINWTAPASGVYYLEVRDFGNDDSGTYTLDVIVNDDHGNSSGAATGIAPGTTTGVIEVSTDVDYFSFTATAGTAYSIETVLTGLSDSTLTLHDTNGTTVLVFDDDGGPGLASRINWVAPSNGTYFIAVDNFSDEVGMYEIILRAQSLVVTPTTLNVAEGATNTFSVSLAAQPTADVTISVERTAGDTDLTVSAGGTLTFTSANWNTPQAVTVDAAEDADAANGSATFTVSSTGLTSIDVTGNEVDNDTQALVVTPTTLDVAEGATSTFNVRLNAQPTTDVTVSVERTAGDADLTVGAGGTLTFTSANWNTPQAVTLAAAEDADAVNGSATFTVSSTGLTSINVTATEDDNDTVVQQPELTISDNSGLTDDSRVSFTTDLGRWRVGGQEVNLVRPSLPDDQHHVIITNSGASPLTIQEIIINAPDVTTSITLGPDAGDDIVLQPGQTLQINLTFAPSLPSVTNATVIDFNLATGLIIRSNAANADANGDTPVSLEGHSTFNSDITYDGNVNLGELGILNVNFGRTSSDANFDPSADINGDGSVNLGDLGPLNVEFGRTRPAADTTSPFGQPDHFLPDEEEHDLWASDPASEPVPLTTDTEDDAEDLLAVDSAMEDADEWLDVI